MSKDAILHGRSVFSLDSTTNKKNIKKMGKQHWNVKMTKAQEEYLRKVA